MRKTIFDLIQILIVTEVYMAALQSDSSELPLLRLIPLINRITENHKQREKKYTKSQSIILLALYYRGLLTMSQIAAFLDSSKEQATRAVAHLVDEEMVKRISSPDDRKHVYVELTDKGRESVEDYNTEMKERIRGKIDASLTDEEKIRLQQSLATVIDLLSKIQ